jgi:hypothetical protein
MENFYFYLDQKVTTWMRTNFEVEAESFEEAVKKANEMYESGKLNDIGWDEVDSTKETMDTKENDGYSTEELYYEDGNLIYQNGK